MLDRIWNYVRSHVAEWGLDLLLAVVVVAVAYSASRIAARLAKRALCARSDERVHTLAPIVGTLTVVLGTGVGVAMGVEKLGFDIKALLAGAGVVGLAVGFGAQTLVKDWLSGFFLILDGAIAVGDYVEVGDRFGLIEKVGLRITQVRGFDGKLWYIPNGEIRVVGNLSRGWVRSVVEVGLAYEQDVSAGLRVLQDVGDTWADEHPDVCLEAPEAQGVLSLADSSVGVRLVIKVVADGNHWAYERELRRRIKAALDDAGVEIPFPRSVVYHRHEDDAAPLQVVTDREKSAA